jgi:hypothetical protein
MKLAAAGMSVFGLLMGSGAARAETALAFVTPQNLKESTFRVTSRASRNHTVQFVVRRDVRNIEGPSSAGYLSHPAINGKGLGKRIKPDVRGDIWTFRFSVPADQVRESVFTLWGAGMPRTGEGVTYRFNLGDFWKSDRE